VLARFPRLKEWADAGMFFNMTGAAVSHLVVGDSLVTLVAPIIFTGLAAASWILRPSDRCVLVSGFEGNVFEIRERKRST
jgi:DoxX-like family